MIDVLKCKKLTPDAKLPFRENEGDMYDVFANEDVIIQKGLSNKPVLVGTGLAFDIPKGYRIKLFNRSSNPLKKGLLLANSTGIIDTGYKDELKVMFWYTGVGEGTEIKISKGDKIAQIQLEKILDFDIVEVNELDKTNDRGGGFGSTDEIKPEDIEFRP